MPPSQSARKRSEAQRKAKVEDEVQIEPIPVQDEAEQEAEIEQLRAKNSSDNRIWRGLLDIVVTVCIVISGSQTLRYINESSSPMILRIVSLAQTFLLPLSLTPSILPRLSPITSKHHNEVMLTHLGLFMVAFLTLRNLAKSSGSEVEVAEVLRWALPELIAGAVEVQRRGEKENEASIGNLEGLKYDLKGA